MFFLTTRFLIAFFAFSSLSAFETSMDEDTLRQEQDFLRNKLEYERQSQRTQSYQQDAVRQDQKVFDQRLQDQRLQNQRIERQIQNRRLEDKRIQQKIDDDRRRR